MILHTANESSHTCMYAQLDYTERHEALRHDHAIIPTNSMSLLQKMKTVMPMSYGSLGWHVTVFETPILIYPQDLLKVLSCKDW